MGDRTTETILLDIPPEKQELKKDPKDPGRGWSVEVNGEPVERVSRVRLHNPAFGVLTYGLDPAGYDRWGFHEHGGGGSVIVPYAHWDDTVYVGLVEQNRPNQGGKVWNAPRGFLKPGETHFQAARREAGEELGADLPVAVEVLPLEGQPMNPNSAFFETWGTNADGSGEGVKCFALEFPALALAGPPLRPTIKPGFLVANPDLASKRVAEQILGCTFYRWSEAMHMGDMFTVAIVGRLVAKIWGRSK